MIFDENVFPFASSLHKGTFPSVLNSIPLIQPYTNVNDVVDYDTTNNIMSQPISLLPITTTNNDITKPSLAQELPLPSLIPELEDTVQRSHKNHQILKHLNEYFYSLLSQKAANTTTLTPTLLPLIMPLNVIFSNNNHVASETLSLNSQLLVKNVCHDSEPSSYKDSTLYPICQAAMTEEFGALQNNHTWGLVSLPARKKTIGFKWVYKVNHKANDSVEI